MNFFVFTALLAGLVAGQASLDHCGLNGKVRLEEFTFHYPIKLFTWLADSPRHYNTQILTSHNGSLWHSTNEGLSWVDITTQLPKWDENFTPYRRHGVQWTYPGSQDPNTVYIKGYGPKLWFVRDMTQPSSSLQIMDFEAPYSFDSLLRHPARDDWLLATGRSDRCFNRTALGECFNSLYLSKNYGQTWTIVTTYVFQASWGNAGLNGVSEDNLFLLSFPDKTGSQYAKPSAQLEFIHTTDYLANKKDHEELAQVVFMLQSQNNTFLVQDEAQGYSLMISTDGGHNFYPARFPFPQLSENQYYILDQTNGSVFVNIRHGTSGFSVSNTYSSGQLSHPTEVYSLSQENTVRSGGRPEFTRMWGIDGIYVGNQWQGEMTTNGGEFLRSEISYDVGGEWNSINLPVDENNVQVTCDLPDCQLNLFGETLLNTYPHAHGPLLSRPGAPGVMMVTGNVGDTRDASEAQTYVTIDGGWTWKRVYDHNSDYQFGDHGSVFVLVDKEGDSVQDLRYSWDMGDSWTDCRFTNYGAIQFVGLFTEPGAVSQNFVVYGLRYDAGTPTQGAYIHVNMTGLHEANCTDGDYEAWSPQDARDEKQKCILGQTLSYTRRKRDANCWNSREFETAVVVSACPCSRDDYECDFCFEPDPLTRQCVQTPDCTEGVAPPTPCNGYYNKSIGYRFIPGTKCDLASGANFLPVRTRCPTSTTGTSGSTTGSSSSTTGSSSSTTGSSSSTTGSSSSTTGSSTTGSSTTGSSTTGSSTTGSSTTGSSTTGSSTTGSSSTSSSSTGSSSTGSSTSGQNNKGGGGISGGAIAAIVIVILLLVGIVGAIVFIKFKMPEVWDKFMGVFSAKPAPPSSDYSLVNQMEEEI